MKKSPFFIAAIVLVTLAAGCEAVDKLLEFDIPYKTTFTVPAVPYDPALTPPLTVASPKFNTGIKKIFEDYSTSRDLIDEITLSSLSLAAKDSTGGTKNFDFLKSVKVYINAAGLPEKELASKDSIPMGVSTLSFTASKVNMTDYIAKDSISVRLAAIQRAANPSALKVECAMKFHVNAKNISK
jgi:hypothetical protein